MAKTSLLDKYYRRPLLYDLIINLIALALVYFLTKKGVIELSFDCESNEIPLLGII
jgi:hypothetical protein